MTKSSVKEHLLNIYKVNGQTDNDAKWNRKLGSGYTWKKRQIYADREVIFHSEMKNA